MQGNAFSQQRQHAAAAEGKTVNCQLNRNCSRSSANGTRASFAMNFRAVPVAA